MYALRAALLPMRSLLFAVHAGEYECQLEPEFRSRWQNPKCTGFVEPEARFASGKKDFSSVSPKFKTGTRIPSLIPLYW